MTELIIDSSFASKIVLLCYDFCNLKENKSLSVTLADHATDYETLPALRETSNPDVALITSPVVILKHLTSLARGDKSVTLYNTRNLIEKAEIDRWLILGSQRDFLCVEDADLQMLNSFLEPRTFLASQANPTLADFVMFGSLYSFFTTSTAKNQEKYPHLSRWFNHIQHYPGIIGVRDLTLKEVFPLCALHDISSNKPLVFAPSATGGKQLHPNTKDVAQKKLKSDKKREKAPAKKTDADPNHGLERAVDDPTRLDIRVGRILEAWIHPDAQKLYCFDLDVGEKEVRKIVSGIREYYALEELKGRTVLVLCNLKPKKLVGFTSNGMLLCGKGPNSEARDIVQLVAPPCDASIGERVFFENLHGEPDAVLSSQKNKDPFAAVQPHFRVLPDGVVTYKDHRFLTSKGPCICSSLSQGTVS